MSMEIKPLYQEIGSRIRKERTAQGFTQLELSQPIGLTRTSVNNIESGRQRLPIHILYHIAYELGVSVCSLLPEF